MITRQVYYNFYNDYLHNKTFTEIFETRKSYIKNKYQLKCTDNELIEEYFVEIFSWTVIDIHLLSEINTIIEKYVPFGILVDPCSGNSFHTFVFNQFSDRQVITLDIQPEENAWIKTLSQDGLDYIQNMSNHKDKILLLSWIDNLGAQLDLPYSLLTSFTGNLIISIGNYRPVDCKKYIDELDNNYKLVQSYECIMPWNLIEEINIFTPLKT